MRRLLPTSIRQFSAKGNLKRNLIPGSTFVFARNGLLNDPNKGLFINHQAYDIAVNLGDPADDTGLCQHFHTFFEAFDKFLLITLPFDLRADQKKVKHYDNQQREQHAHQACATAGGGLKENKLQHGEVVKHLTIK